jgi:hypothetical protein
MTDSVGKKTIYEYDDLARKKKVTQKLDRLLATGADEIVNPTAYYANGNIKEIIDCSIFSPVPKVRVYCLPCWKISW